MILKGLFGLNIFLSAFLIFFFQPVLAKALLPRYGGSAFVWVASVLFFQTGLLIGYLYAHLLAKYFKIKGQIFIHGALLAGSLFFMPLGLTTQSVHLELLPLEIFFILTFSVFLPYLVITASTPLMQRWYHDLRPSHSPYGFYAVSNAGSLLGLFLYPLLLEMLLPLANQLSVWSGLYGLYMVICAVCAGWLLKKSPQTQFSHAQVSKVRVREAMVWVAFSMLGVIFFLSTTYFIAQNMINMPLIWVLPLALYLISFIMTFSKEKPYHALFWAQLFVVWVMLFSGLMYKGALNDLDTLLILLALMYTGLMICHGTLFKFRPPAHNLTYFYLMIALGGVLGSLFVNFLPLYLFNYWWDLHLPIAVVLGMATLYLWRTYQRDKNAWNLAASWIAFITYPLYIMMLGFHWVDGDSQVIFRDRNAYGLVTVLEQHFKNKNVTFRQLNHGSTLHGLQYLDEARKQRPTTYYTPESGLGAALAYLQSSSKPIHVGAIGLGTGTLATYLRPQDTMVVFEIDPTMIEVSQQYFSFVPQSQGQIQLIAGDGRLKMQQMPNEVFDLIVIDAFSGDNIPFHLITQEAFETYAKHLKPQGIMAFHISNTFVNLVPVTLGLAEKHAYYHHWIINFQDLSTFRLTSEWCLLTQEPQFKPWVLKYLPHRFQPQNTLTPRYWTDDFNSILPVLRLKTEK